MRRSSVMNKKIILSMVGMMLFGMIIGTGIMMNDEAYKAVKGAIDGGGTDNMIGYMGVNGINPLQIQSMDIETALLMVQSNRANLLETQLKDHTLYGWHDVVRNDYWNRNYDE